MALDTDDLEPRPVPAAKAPPKDLGVMSVEELKTYIAGLEAEIERARAAIAGKEAHRSAAEALFKR